MSIHTLSQYKWIGFLLILFAIWLFALGPAIKDRKNFLRLQNILCFWGVLYPVTKISQYFFIGPTLYRSYCADIGFIPFVSMIFFYNFPLLYRDKTFDETISRFNSLKIYAFCVGIFAIGYEIFQIEYQNHVSNDLSGIKGFTGRGDFVDLFVFFITLTIEVWIIDYKKNRYIKLNNQLQELKKFKKRQKFRRK